MRPHDGVNVTDFAGMELGQANLWLEIGQRGEAIGPITEVRYGDTRFLDVLWPGPVMFDDTLDPDLDPYEARLVHENGTETRLMNFSFSEWED